MEAEPWFKHDGTSHRCQLPLTQHGLLARMLKNHISVKPLSIATDLEVSAGNSNIAYFRGTHHERTGFEPGIVLTLDTLDSLSSSILTE